MLAYTQHHVKLFKLSSFVPAKVMQGKHNMWATSHPMEGRTFPPYSKLARSTSFYMRELALMFNLTNLINMIACPTITICGHAREHAHLTVRNLTLHFFSHSRYLRAGPCMFATVTPRRYWQNRTMSIFFTHGNPTPYAQHIFQVKGVTL